MTMVRAVGAAQASELAERLRFDPGLTGGARRVAVRAAGAAHSWDWGNVATVVKALPAGERLDAAEILLPRVKEVTTDASVLLEVFRGEHKRYVAAMLAVASARSEVDGRKRSRDDVVAVAPVLVWSKAAVEEFVAAATASLSMDRRDVQRELARKNGLGINAKQLAWMLQEVVVAHEDASARQARLEELLQLLKGFVCFLTTESVAALCNDLGKVDMRLNSAFLPVAMGLVCDPENLAQMFSWVHDVVDPAVLHFVQQQVRAGPAYPCSPFFGSKRERRRVVFLVDGSSVGAATTSTLSGELISVFRLGIRDLIRTLHEQVVDVSSGDKLSGDDVFFNVGILTDTVRFWSPVLEPASFDNVSHAAMFLRAHHPSGAARDVQHAFAELCNKYQASVDHVSLLLFGPPVGERPSSRASPHTVNPDLAHSPDHAKAKRRGVDGDERVLKDIQDSLRTVEGPMISISPTLLVSSRSNKEDLGRAARFVTGLAKLGDNGGDARIVSCSKRLRRWEDLFPARGEHGLFQLSKVQEHLLLLVVLAAFSILASLLPRIASGEIGGGYPCTSVEAMYPVFLAMHPGGHKIWQFMCLAWGFHTVYLANIRYLMPGSPQRSRRALILVIQSVCFSVYVISTVTSLLFFTRDKPGLALLMSLVQLGSVVVMLTGLLQGHRVIPTHNAATYRVARLRFPSVFEQAMVQGPVTMALCISAFQACQLSLIFVVVVVGLGASIEFTMALAFLAIFSALTLFMAKNARSPTFTLTAAWIFSSISRNYSDMALHSRVLGSSVGQLQVSGERIVQVCASLMFVASIALGTFRATETALLHLNKLCTLDPHVWTTRRKERRKTIFLQSLNFASFVVLAVVAFWGSPISGDQRCCGDLHVRLHNRFQGEPVFLMIPVWCFEVMWVFLLVARCAFAFAQMLPSEVCVADAQHVRQARQDDLSLGRQFFFRSGERPVWMLSWRSHQLLVQNLGLCSVFLNASEALFIVLFFNNLWWAAFFTLCLSFGTALLTYSATVGFSTVNSLCAPCRSRKQARLRLQEHHAKHQTAPQGACSPLWRRFRTDVLRIPDTSDRDAADMRRDTSKARKLTPLSVPDGPTNTWSEFVLVRCPAGFLLGWFLYLLALLLMVAVQDTVGGSLKNADLWTVLADLVVVVVAVLLGFRANQATILVGLGWAFLGRVVASFVSVCDSQSVFGQSIRQREPHPFLVHWDKDEAACSSLAGFRFRDGHCRKHLVNCTEPGRGFMSVSDGSDNFACVEEPLLCPVKLSHLDVLPVQEFVTGWAALTCFVILFLVSLGLLWLTPSRRHTLFDSKVSARRNKRMMTFTSAS